MMSVRPNNFNENSLGEPDQDANSALTELDKGLRSGKIGEQCEAIVRFPKLFEKYPFPILINASLLKLADVFRMGSNFLRLCVLRVCQQSEKHLDKISSVDEFVRRIFTVIHSNDPIARAVTLRTFGAVAIIIPERQQIHHCIRSSLDSHDNVEVEAAITAAIQFAAQSRLFAISMCNKVSVMIQGQSTPANMKLQLIPILQYMHHDTTTAAMVRTLCIDLLPSYPSQDFVLVTLNALTHLAVATLVDIPSQVLLLLDYLKNDTRWQVKSKCLQYLNELAKPGGHLWPPGTIDQMIEIATDTVSCKILVSTLRVLLELSKSPRMCHDHRLTSSKLWQLCAQNCYSSNNTVAVKSIQILTQILCYCYKENLENEGADQVITSIETLMVLLKNTNENKQLKHTLKCALSLCVAKKEHCENFVNLLGVNLDGAENNETTLIIGETLGAIGSLKVDALLPILSTLISHLDMIALLPSDDDTFYSRRIKTMLCTLVFQCLADYKWHAKIEQTIKNITVQSKDLWTSYCTARSAVRYGHHKIAVDILKDLTDRVSSEHYHFWLMSLREMSSAETKLQMGGNLDRLQMVEVLDAAIVHYNKALAALKAASTPQHCLQFQTEYMRIRLEFLQCLVQLVHSSTILCIVPPPAIAATIVQNTRDEYQRHGYITNQLRKSAKEFKNCGDMYWRLYQTAFDADPATLENLQILQQMCVLVEQSVDSICMNGVRVQGESFDWDNIHLESQPLARACENGLKIAQIIHEAPSNSTISHKDVELIKKLVQILSISPLPIPRYFFQILQSTSVKLAVSPQPRVMGECISVQPNSQLTVKVEGVIQHGGSKPGLFRKISEMIVTVTSQLQTNTKSKDFEIKTMEPSSVLTQSAVPHRDFFTVQFLLAFPKGGQYLLVIEALVIDDESNTWKTGPRSTLTVKVPEELKPPPIIIPGMTTNANLILMPEDKLFNRPFQKK